MTTHHSTQHHDPARRSLLWTSLVGVMAMMLSIIPPSAAWAPPSLAGTQRLAIGQPQQQQRQQLQLSRKIGIKLTTGLALASDAVGQQQQQQGDDAGDDGSPLQESLNQEVEPALQQQQQQQRRAPSPPPPPPRRLDPLIASLTRMDEATRNAPTVKAPLFGEIHLDGSLVVLVPTVLIGVAGVVMSIYIAFHSPDAIVASFNDWNQELANAATSPQAPQILSPDENGCRGLCSTQEQDLVGLRVFMENLAGRNK